MQTITILMMIWISELRPIMPPYG